MKAESAAARLEARRWRFCSSAGRSALGMREPAHSAAAAPSEGPAAPGGGSGSAAGSRSSSSACARSSGERGSPGSRMAAYLPPSVASDFWQSTSSEVVGASEGSYACTRQR